MHLLARDDEFSLSHCGNTVQLRPSLRAAMRLERLHDGFGPLITMLDQFNTSTIRDMILIAVSDYSAAQRFLASINTKPVQTYRHAVTGPLSSLLAAFFPPEASDTTGTSTTPEKAVPWSEAYAQLYQIGTGWLGWTPAETWAATPTEITQALEGRVAHLIEGYEDSYGMELLSSMHWVMVNNAGAKEKKAVAIEGVLSWNAAKRKRLKPEHLDKAWERLTALGWS